MGVEPARRTEHRRSSPAVRCVAPWGLAALAAAGLGATRGDAQSIRLNGPLVQPLGGDVTDYRISPDGAYVVYRADQEHDEVFELFAAPSDGSAPAVRLSAPQPAESDADVGDFAVAGSRVVFLWVDSGAALYSAPLTGGAPPTELSGSLSETVHSFQLEPDGTRAVLRAGSPARLFSVPVDGSDLPADLDPENRPTLPFYDISPDGTFVVFNTGFYLFDESLRRVPIDASEPPLELAHLGYGFIDGNTFEDVKLSSDGEHAAYWHFATPLDREAGGCGPPFQSNRSDIHGLALDGSSDVRLSLQENWCGGFSVDCPCDFAFEPAGSHVVFMEPGELLYTIEADGNGRALLGANVHTFALSPDESQVVFLSGTPSSSLLQIAPIDGSSVTALAGPGAIESPQVSPDSVVVVFIATVPSTDFRGLFAVAATGGAPLLLNGPMIPGGRGVRDFAISPVGGSIVYREERDADERLELWSVDGSFITRKLSGPLDDFRDVVSFQIAPDGQRAVYLADQNSDEAMELFGAPVEGGALVQYNEPLAGGPVAGDVLSFLATPDASRVVYRADQDVDEFVELYSTPSSGQGQPFRLTSPTPDVGDVRSDVYVTPQGDRVVAQLEFESGLFALFSRVTSGAEPLVTLDTSSLPFNGNFVASPLAFDPSGTNALYLKGGVGLRSVRVDGSQPPIDLATPPDPHEVQRFIPSPDRLRLAYVADQDTDEMFELYSVPSDGSAPAVKLSQPPIANGDVFSFSIAFSPDSSRVLYRGRLEDPNRVELYSVLADGSALPIKLNPAFVTGGVVEAVQVTPDSSHAVFTATTNGSVAVELYSAPVDGSTPAVRLTTLPNFRGVEPDYQIRADGLAVYFRANPASSTRFELYGVPVDGSSAPVRLSALPVAGGSVTSFALSPDQSLLVYLSDQRINDVFELFAVSTAGGPVIALTVLPATADVTSFRIDLESTGVIYLADALTDETFELFRAPSAAPERISRNLGPGGDVQPDFVVQPGGHVLHRADAEGDDVFELFHFVNTGPAKLAPFGGPVKPSKFP